VSLCASFASSVVKISRKDHKEGTKITESYSSIMYFIRKAKPDDVETIRSIAEKTWRHTYSPILEKEQLDYMLREIYSAEKIKEQIENDSQTYLLLIEPALPAGGDDKPVAFAGYAPREEDPEIYKLHKLYCLPETQGKGYGKILINEVANKTIEAGKHTLDLNVNRYNKAKTFYEKMGFVVAYEEDVPIGKYWMNDFVMRKEL
jgi:GNAT superfamily N-acetyltransferase